MELEADTSSRPGRAWAANKIRIRHSQSFLRFVLPVAFPESEGRGYGFEQRSEKLANSGQWHLLRGEKQGFLPQVRMHLNTVKSYHRHPIKDAKQKALSLDAVTAFGYIFAANEITGLGFPGTEFLFRIPGTGRGVRAEVTGAQIGIFRLGVGFVGFEVILQSEALPDWLEALHFLRFYRGRGERLEFTSVTVPSGTADVTRVESLLGPLLAAAGLDDEISPLAPWEEGAGPQRGRRVKELYTRGELLTYAALFADGVPESDRRYLLYNVLNRFRPSNLVEPGVGGNDSEWCLTYQNGQQFLNSVEGSSFVAFDVEPTDFNLHTLPSHLRSIYFTVFFLALLQRFALDQLSEAVARSTGRVLLGSERGRAAGELERVTTLDSRLLDFTGRCYFVQVSQAAHHHSYYAMLREVNQIEDRYREVTDEVHALRAHAASRVSAEQERTSVRVAAALMVITCILLPLQVIESLFSAKISQLPGIRSLSPTWSATTAGAVLLLAIGVALSILYAGRRRRRQR
jgi:hypothetical protein